MLWQTNRIKHRQPHRRQLQLHPSAAKVAAPVEVIAAVDMVVAADVAKADQVVVDAVKAAPVVQAEDPAVLAAANGNFFAKRKSANSVSKKWI